jgi:hypothetical protein
MNAQAHEHSISKIEQDPHAGTEGTVRVTCTCGQARENRPHYGTGLNHLVGEELHSQGVTVPEAKARGLLAAVHAHGEAHWTGPPEDALVQHDLARAADRLTSGAANLRLRAALLSEAASQLEAGAAELREFSGRLGS